jgi:transposase InsO family protein
MRPEHAAIWRRTIKLLPLDVGHRAALNGKVEQSHRSDQKEFSQLAAYKHAIDLMARFDEWKEFYNFNRPHGAVNLKTPYEDLGEQLQ